MKKVILKKYNKLISIFLSMLGIGGTISFTSCENITPAAEYGTPHATFKIYGKVASKQGVKIPQIKVVMYYDSSYTDEHGNYQVQVSAFPSSQDFILKFEDVDGEVNGAYETKDTLISFVNPQFENGSDSWYAGETSKELDIEMTEEK